MMYQFEDKLAEGQAGEAMLDQVFSRWYNIEPASREQQRLGIDRLFRRRSNHELVSVEYKTDRTAGRTGNAFVETVSVDTAGKRGWAHTSQADVLIYFVPDPDTIYVIRFDALRRALPRWLQQYPKRRIPNNGYHTHGVLVPLHEFERLALVVF